MKKTISARRVQDIQSCSYFYYDINVCYFHKTVGEIPMLALKNCRYCIQKRCPFVLVVRTYLFLQNSAVILCAISVFLRLHYEADILTMLDGHMSRIMEAILIILAIAAQLASVGSKIAIERDWIVVIAAKDKDKLAST